MLKMFKPKPIFPRQVFCNIQNPAIPKSQIPKPSKSCEVQAWRR